LVVAVAGAEAVAVGVAGDGAKGQVVEVIDDGLCSVVGGGAGGGHLFDAAEGITVHGDRSASGVLGLYEVVGVIVSIGGGEGGAVGGVILLGEVTTGIFTPSVTFYPPSFFE